jgi:hypothetical protein
MKMNRKKGFTLGVFAIAGIATVAVAGIATVAVLSVPALMAPITVPALVVYGLGAAMASSAAGNALAAMQRRKAPTGPGPQAPGKPPSNPAP